MIDYTSLVVLSGIVLLSALLASRFGLSVAILEVVAGIVAANVFGITPAYGGGWLPVLATLGGLFLTFLAGVETDPAVLRREWKAVGRIGLASFLSPFLVVTAVSRFLLHWTWGASLLTGLALSETSVAMVYVVLTETGGSRTATGKVLLSACFLTDLIAAIVLTGLFATWGLMLAVLLAALVATVLLAPRLGPLIASRVRRMPGESGVKLVLFLLLLLGALATWAGTAAVLPAYVLGFALSTTLAHERETVLRLRSVTLSLLTPFFFLSAGLEVSWVAVLGGVLAIALLFSSKVGAKLLAVLPSSRRYTPQDAVYVALLNCTGLTFGVIFALAGSTLGLLSSAQYSILLVIIILTAVVPTMVAQRGFAPRAPPHPEGA